MSTAPLTLAELSDTRRYCGYPVAAGLAFQPGDVQGASGVMDAVLAQLTDEQVGTLRTVYLANLGPLEAALPATGEGLDVAKAAVYMRNPQEVAEREALFVSWRQKLCYFLGVAFGSGLIMGPTATGGAGSGSSSAIPAAFLV